MPRPVCVKCQREMSVKRPVVVQLNADAVKGPYQQWNGDLAECGGCGAQIVAGFAELPFWRHYHLEPGQRPDVIVEERSVA